MRGITFRLLHSLPAGQFIVSLERARDAGADTVCLVPHHYCMCAPNTSEAAPPDWSPRTLIFPDSAQMWPGIGNTPAIDNVAELAWAAREMGMDLWLKPHVDVGWWHEGTGWGVGGWRGYLQVPRARAYRWWVAYHAMMRPYLDLARSTGAGIVLGCELLQITRDYGAGVWIDLAAWVRRQRFTGPLTYASNWGEEVQRCSPLWNSPEIAYIGVDWYVPLPEWEEQARMLRSLVEQVGKPLLFTEIGFPNYPGAQHEPWHDWTPQDTPTDDEQLAGWRHFRDDWRGCDYLAWESPVVGQQVLPVNHNVLRTEPLALTALGV